MPGKRLTYGCMIDACVRCGYVQKAVSIFQEMKSMRKHRNTILYTTLIKGYGLDKDLRGALALFREMKEERVPYNRITYNSIIDVCVKCNDVQAAENLFTEMTSPVDKIEPDLITYSTLLKGYCQIGDLDKALQVAETIKECGLRCDELVYNTLMDGCVRAGDLSAGVGLFAEMTRSGLWPSLITHSILMRLYQQSGYPGDAREAVAQLYKDHGLARPPTRQDHQGGGARRSRDGHWQRNHRANAGGHTDGARVGHAETGHSAVVGADNVSSGTQNALAQSVVWQPGLQGPVPQTAEVPQLPPGVFFGPEAALLPPYEYMSGGCPSCPFDGTAGEQSPALPPGNNSSFLQQPAGQYASSSGHVTFQAAEEPYACSMHMLPADAAGMFCGGGLYSGGMYSGMQDPESLGGPDW
jgi:pentatricopeptide repeat protein